MSSSLLLIYPAYSPFMGSIMKSSLGRLAWRCQESWWPCGCQLACSASVCRVLPQNSSCLRGYCQACFARNVSENQAQAQRAGCMVCGSAISADNKSPMPGCCFHCQSKQEVEFENVQEQEPALETSAGLASPKPITREPSPPPLPPPADPPPD